MGSNSQKILIIEDELAIRELLVDIFKDEGFNVYEAQSGELGLKYAYKHKPDLILLDIILPQMDGLAMLKKLRKDPWGESVPVIVMSNLNDQERISEAIKLGVYDYVIKMNMQLKGLVKEVKEALENNESHIR